MQLPLFLSIALLLIICQASAFHRPEVKTRNAGFPRKKTSKVGSTDGYKLPGNARPTLYDVTLTLNPNSQVVSGVVTITLNVDPSNTTDKTKKLQLNSGINLEGDVQPTFLWNNVDQCSLADYDEAHFEILCPKSIEGNAQTLKITYTTNYASIDEYGMYVINYKEGDNVKKMIATQLEQAYARRLFPCFDEPGYKAPIKLTLITDTTDYDWSHWVSNMKVASETVKGKVVTTTFQTTPSMSAYLLAFVATSDFKNYSSPALSADYEFEIFSKPSSEQYVSIALENGPKLIHLMGQLTGITYKSLGNDRMVFAAIPEFTDGAMENWGLITFREQNLLDEGADTTVRDKQNIIKVIAHELSHQWFGDYVTLDWWSETWLNEGFATYFEYLLSDQLFPDLNFLKQFILKEKQQALKTDGYPDAVPLSNNASEVTTNVDFLNEFGDISYSKGASIVYLLHETLGDVTFKDGLQTYLHLNKYSNTTAQLLLDALQSAVPEGTDMDLSKLFKEWIYENGYPLLDVSLNEKNQVTVTANKFSSSLDKSKENKTAIWWIPLTYTTSANPDFNKTITYQWTYSSDLSKFSLTLPNNTNSWIIFNLQSIGYYRVNYDQTLWDRIINVLSNADTYKTIDVLNRAQLIDDIFNVAKSYKSTEQNGTLYYLTAFKLAEYLKHETEYYPWYTFLNEMQYLMEVIQDEFTLSILKYKILSLISPQLVIPQDSDKPSQIDILKRNLLLTWACNLGDKTCTKWAKEQFIYFKYKLSFSVSTDYRDVILCTGIAQETTSRENYDFVYPYMIYSLLPYEQLDLLKALTCRKDGNITLELLTKTINYTLNEPPFTRMYNDKIISTLITKGSDNIQSALKFVLTYDSDIEKYWQQIEDVETLVKKIATKIYSKKHVDTINEYIVNHQNNTDYATKIQACKEAITIANGNIAYLNEYSAILTSVIVETTPTTVAPPDTTTPASANKITYNILLATILAILLKSILC